MIKLLCISDIHGNEKVLEVILRTAGKSDAVLLGGDLTHFGCPDDAERIVRLVQNFNPNVYAVAGNCDSKAIERRLNELGVGIGGKGRLLGALGIHGLSGAPPWQPTMYEFSEAELGRFLEAGAQALNAAKLYVVLSHPPPRGCLLDRTFLWKHVGSTALRDFVAARQPELVVCGHIHESRGVEQLGRTTVVNCGPATRGYYALAEVDREVRVALHRV
ncbi:MAG: metallophosphoesterase family protein [Pirellulales bacterium]|nr:metallophosphoesterase family protein [Pirellulales bacterium]